MSHIPVNTGPTGSPLAVGPSVAMRRSPNGAFVDFHLLPVLLRRAAACESRERTVAEWALLMGRLNCSTRFQEHDGAPADLDLLASDTWRLASLSGLLSESGRTEAGRRVADAEDDAAAALADGISKYLVGQGGAQIVPLLQMGAGELSGTDHVWARFCSGLLPIEMGAIVHWACIDTRKCRELLDNLVTWRDVAMHRHGWPNPKNTKAENAATHYDATVDFYLSHPWLAERTPMSFGEEFAMVKLLDYCGLLEEKSLGTFMPYLVPPD